MAMKRYLAMTAAEIRRIELIPGNIAWMACHFSPYTTGLSNYPKGIPAGSLLIVNDITPIHGHDPEVIAAQLNHWMGEFDCAGVLLDLQRPGFGETAELAEYLVEKLSCVPAVSQLYAGELDCPVFLPPPPLYVPLAEYLSPWKGREAWLEMAMGTQCITLTEDGASIGPGEAMGEGYREEGLHCHYHIEKEESRVKFQLWRTREDMEELMEEAQKLGVTHGVGLYQELGK